MKNITLLAYVAFGYPINSPYFENQIRNALNRRGFQVRSINIGGSPDGKSQFSYLQERWGYYITIRLRVPKNFSVTNVRSNVVAVLASWAKVSAISAQLGETQNVEAENKPEILESNVEVIEESEESFDDSWLWALGGFALGWVVTRK